MGLLSADRGDEFLPDPSARRSLMWTRRAIAGAAAGACLPGGDAPRRVVSLNPCLDVILVHIADRTQIAALSHYARDASSSTIADIARTLPFTYESAEEILSLDPDLVLASTHSALATRQALSRLDIAVATYSVPNSVEETLAQITDIAGRVHRHARGEALTTRIRATIDTAARSATRRPIKALVFQSRGLVAGRGTLLDEMMARLGFENVAARYGVAQWGSVPLERVLENPPELLLSAPPSPGAQAYSERLLHHPALASISGRMRRGDFPAACLYCGGPVLLETTQALVAARDAFWAGV